LTRTLKNTGGLFYSDTQAQAEILNHQLHSIFTRENTSNIPSKGKSPYQSMTHIKVSIKGLKKLLKGLNIHKTTDPDSFMILLTS
jgi:hypothetical protein